jgi:uncharacterized Zn finger protein
MTNATDADNGRTEIETLDDISEGDEVTIESDGETLVEDVEITEIEVGGFAGEKTFKTDADLDINASSLDVLLIDCYSAGSITGYIN